MDAADLPINAILAPVLDALAQKPNAIIAAPPASGKSTGVPPALLSADWAAGKQIVLLQPRRVAVRSLAYRLAELSGKPLGDLIGYQMRDDVRVNAKTRLVVMTEGVLKRRLLADPELDGLAAVIFDEFHERTLDADLCLALCRDVQETLRPDLRLLLMSATLDLSTILPHLPGFQVFEAEGRAFPVDTTYLPRRADRPLTHAMLRGIDMALRETDRDILCFLPGARDIRALERMLDDQGSAKTADVVPLYGALPFAQQKAAVEPGPDGTRRIILATDIAETSLTLPNVTAVVDSGRRRAPGSDMALGLTYLRTVRASRASVDQRRGRAGRVAPGRCYRLWAEEEMKALHAADPPAMETSDLTALKLALADWGAAEADAIAWLTPPPAKALSLASERLEQLGLLSPGGAITAAGRLAAQLPMAPDIAALLIGCVDSEDARRAALLCALLADGGDAIQRHQGDLAQAVDWVSAAGKRSEARTIRRAEQWLGLIKAQRLPATDQQTQSVSLGGRFALARPWLIAQKRAGGDGQFKLASGRGAFVEPHSSLAQADYFVVGEALLSGSDVRILSAWPLPRADVETELAYIIEQRHNDVVEPGGAGVRETRAVIGALSIRKNRESLNAGQALGRLFLTHIQKTGLAALPWPERFSLLQDRVRFARRFDASLPDVSFDALSKEAETWLLPFLEGMSSLKALDGALLMEAVQTRLGYHDMQRLNQIAPDSYRLPAGNQVPISYTAEGQAVVSGKLQAFFGLAQHPTVAQGQVPLTVALLSPAGRPVQTTQDLPGFWVGSYDAVRRDLRGRYPKHPWPDDPATAVPTNAAKRRR